jgi:hypothetical protein
MTLQSRRRHSGMVRRTRPGISRFRVRCCASPRNDGVWVASLAMTSSPHTTSRSRRDAPEPLINLSPPWRAWGMPGARCTRGLVCTCSGRKHTSNNEYTGIARHSRTQWFYGLCRALPGDRALLPPSSADMSCLSPVGPTQLRELDASVGASGPRDFAVRSNISRQRAGDRSQVPKNPPCDPIARKTLPRPPQPTPRS